MSKKVNRNKKNRKMSRKAKKVLRKQIIVIVAVLLMFAAGLYLTDAQLTNAICCASLALEVISFVNKIDEAIEKLKKS